MPDQAGKKAADAARREAAAWVARMRGPDAESSRLAFERWRVASPLHRRLYEEMQAISRQAQGLGQSESARNYYDRRDRMGGIWRPGWALAAAGVAATVLAASGALILTHSVPPATGGKPILTAIGHIDRLRLADGTLVTLDTDSEIVPVFDGARRLVHMVRGRARFEVSHEGRPFVVEAGNRVIFDRGTVFDVAMGRDGVRISLLRGAVEIRDRQSAPGSRALVRLVPGQMFDDGASGGMPLVSVAPQGTARWTSGMLSYDGAALSDVVADAGRYSARKLRLSDPSLAALRVTGTFKAVPIESLAAALAAVLNLRVAVASNGDLILRR